MTTADNTTAKSTTAILLTTPLTDYQVTALTLM